MDATSSLHEMLALEVLDEHTDEAAGVLERLPPSAIAALFGRVELERAASALERIDPYVASAVLSTLDLETAVRLVESLPLLAAARLLRRVDADRAESLLAGQEARRSRSLRALVRYREGTAGALMDPEVLALPLELGAAEALERVREASDRARYNLYVVDREQKLVGALNLHELLQASPSEALSSLMNRDPLRVAAETESRAIVEHPGWRAVTALPVVDRDGAYLGALRYRTLRRLESELVRGRPDGPSAADSLGDLFATATAGMVEAALGAPSRRTRGGADVG